VSRFSPPFFLPGGATGCLLIHGFTATPQEMAFLGARLHAAGCTVTGVRLAGHGTSVEELARVTWRDWYASARDALLGLQARVPRIAVVGQSMGALLAVQLAAEYPTAVTGLALLAPAFVLSKRRLRWLAPSFPFLTWLSGQRVRSVAKTDSDIADARARAERESYERIPLRALHQFVALQDQARAQLSRVRQPVLVIHSRQDHTCPLANLGVLERGLGRPVERLVLDDSYHVVSVDVDKERVADAVIVFVRGCAPS